jgi:hypothetical protein
MTLKSTDGGWSPYLAGALLGVLAIVSVLATTELLGKTTYLGASTTFVRAAGYLERAVTDRDLSENTYFAKTKIKVDWQFMLVIGIFSERWSHRSPTAASASRRFPRPGENASVRRSANGPSALS